MRVCLPVCLRPSPCCCLHVHEPVVVHEGVHICDWQHYYYYYYYDYYDYYDYYVLRTTYYYYYYYY